jgi:hypothetical protein
MERAMSDPCQCVAIRDVVVAAGRTPKTEEGIKDLEDFKRAVWGRLFDDPVQ